MCCKKKIVSTEQMNEITCGTSVENTDDRPQQHRGSFVVEYDDNRGSGKILLVFEPHTVLMSQVLHFPIQRYFLTRHYIKLVLIEAPLRLHCFFTRMNNSGPVLTYRKFMKSISTLELDKKPVHHRNILRFLTLLKRIS